MRFGRSMFAIALALSLGAAACGSDADDAGTDVVSEDSVPEDGGSEDAGSDDTVAEDTENESGDTGGEGAAAALDIDAVLAADLEACGDAPSGDPIKVGMAMDFGDVSGFADIPGSEAVKHLAELINCSGGVNGSPVEVQVQDIQGDIEVTSQATQDLLDFGSHFLIGPPFADFGQPVLQVTGGEVPVFFAASTEPTLSDAEVNAFLVTFDDTAQATAAAEWALEEGFTRAITFSAPGPYFGYNPEVFTEVFTAGGGEVIIDQTYVPVDDVDFSAQVNAVAAVAEGDEVVYSAMLAHQVTALRGQLEGQGLDGLTYVGSDSFEATGLLAPENAPANEGMVHTTHAFVAPGGRIEALLESYAATNGEELESGSFAGLYADALLIGLQAIVECECTEPAEIGAAVAQIDGFDGFTGEMTYGGSATPTKPVSIHRVVDGVDTLVADWE